jgi:serine/threonine-protein kinase
MEENRKKIEELREFYKNKKSNKFDYSDDDILSNSNASNQDEDIDEELDYNPNYIDFKYILHKIKSIKFQSNRLYKYALATLMFCIGVYFAIFFVDSVFIKNAVHNREIIVVPNVIGQKLGEAQLNLNEKNLKYEVIKRQFDLKHPQGTVIRQVPTPGRQIKENRIIYLTISEGVEEITTPDLVNLTSRQARVELVNSGLNLGEVSEISSENIEPGLVISQSPKKGTRLNYNDKVNIVISKGSENQILLKDFKFKRLSEVEEMLSDMGLKVGSIIYVEDETFEDGTVIGQFPLSGEVVLRNSYIDLEVVKN